METRAKWYVLYRETPIKVGWDATDKMDREYTIVYALNPLTGNPSWSLLSGVGYSSCDEARKEID